MSHSPICESSKLVFSFGSDAKPKLDTEETHEYLKKHDDLIRTSETCRRPDLYSCPVCCGKICCEDVENLPVQAPDFKPGEQMWISLRFIFLLKEDQLSWFTEDNIWEELKVVNSEFKRFNIPIRVFYNESVYVHNNLYASNCNTRVCVTNQDCIFFKKVLPQLIHHPAEVINIFMCSNLPIGGVSTYAWSNYETDLHNFIVLDDIAMIPRKYNWEDHIGKTLIHEMGHYFGVLHTFEPTGVCDGVGDFVNDTPAVKSPGPKWVECDEPYDSCPDQPGIAAKDNYMDYFWQKCQNKFTPGQLVRLRKSIRIFKPLLRVNTLIQNKHVQCTKDALYMQNCTLLTKHCITNSQSCQLLQPMKGQERTNLIQFNDIDYSVLNTYNRHRDKNNIFLHNNLSTSAVMKVVLSTGFKPFECQYASNIKLLVGEPLLIVQGSGLTQRNLYLESCIYYRAEKSIFVFAIPHSDLVAIFSNKSNWISNFTDDDVLSECNATVIQYCTRIKTKTIIQYIKNMNNIRYLYISIAIIILISIVLLKTIKQLHSPH